MQTLKFTTENGSITLNDRGQSYINNAAVDVILSGLDPNSLGLETDTVRCVDMPGQHTVSTTVNPRTLTLTVTFNGVKNGRNREYTMYSLRRRLLRAFPLGIKGELEYSNGTATSYLTAYACEYPVIERMAGTQCKATLYLTADYPFWHRDVTGNVYTLGAEDAVAVSVLTEGDIESPLIVTITCTREMTIPENIRSWCHIWEPYTDDGSDMRLVKPVPVNHSLVISTGLNNEVYVRLMNGSRTVLENASDYVVFRSGKLLKNHKGTTVWQVNTYFTQGEIAVQSCYQNIYWAV